MIKGIVCVAKDWGIGKNNGLLFNLPADMQFFRATTQHSIVVMGYSTYMSLPKRPLPNRINVVLWDKAPLPVETKDGAIFFNNFETLYTFVDILAHVGKQLGKEEYDVYIAGGASIYKLFLPYYDEILLTYVDATDPEATVFFPNLDNEKISYYLDEVTGKGKDDKSGLTYEFRTYKRRENSII